MDDAVVREGESAKFFGDVGKWVSKAGKTIGKGATKAYKTTSKWADKVPALMYDCDDTSYLHWLVYDCDDACDCDDMTCLTTGWENDCQRCAKGIQNNFQRCKEGLQKDRQMGRQGACTRCSILITVRPY